MVCKDGNEQNKDGKPLNFGSKWENSYQCMDDNKFPL